jgi:hypothetical protein
MGGLDAVAYQGKEPDMQTIVNFVSLLRLRRRDKPKQRKPLKKRQDERELLFWTLEEILTLGRQTLRLLFLAAVVIYAIVSMIEGRLPDIESIIDGL